MRQKRYSGLYWLKAWVRIGFMNVHWKENLLMGKREKPLRNTWRISEGSYRRGTFENWWIGKKSCIWILFNREKKNPLSFFTLLRIRVMKGSNPSRTQSFEGFSENAIITNLVYWNQEYDSLLLNLFVYY